MTDGVQTTASTTTKPGWMTALRRHIAELRRREGQIFLVLALVIGAVTGLVVVAFILLTERLGMRLYPVGGAPWRRLLFPVAGSLGIGASANLAFDPAGVVSVALFDAAHGTAPDIAGKNLVNVLAFATLNDHQAGDPFATPGARIVNVVALLELAGINTEKY